MMTTRKVLMTAILGLFSATGLANGPGPTPGIKHITEAVDCDGNLHEFVRDPDSKQLYHRENGAFWHPLSGGLSSEPKPAVGADCKVRIFVRGTNLRTYVRTLTTGWVDLGGTAWSAPEPFNHGNDTYVTVVGTDGRLWVRSLRRGWSRGNANHPTPVDFPGIDLDDDFSQDDDFIGADPLPFPRGTHSGRGPTPGIDHVSVAEDCSGDLHLFRKDPYSGALLTKTVFDRFYKSLGGVITSEPKAIVTDDCKLHIFARGTDLAIYYRGLNFGWRSLGGVSYSAPYISALNGNDVQVVVFGTDGRLWNRSIRTGWRHFQIPDFPVFPEF